MHVSHVGMWCLGTRLSQGAEVTKFVLSFLRVTDEGSELKLRLPCKRRIQKLHDRSSYEYCCKASPESRWVSVVVEESVKLLEPSQWLQRAQHESEPTCP